MIEKEYGKKWTKEEEKKEIDIEEVAGDMG